MEDAAFVATWGGNSIQVVPKTRVCARFRTRYSVTTRTLHMTGQENLYPEPDLPESIDNPVKPGASVPLSEDSLDSLVEKLNERRKNREAKTAMTNTSLESSAELQQVSGVHASLDFVSASKALWRLGWTAWWVQLILTVVSAIILLFSFAFPGVNIRSSASAVGFILSGIGVLIAFLSLFWTYSYTRLSLWLQDGSKRTTERAQARINGKLRIGLLLAIVGLVTSLIGLQAIVGTLLARLLSAGIATVPYNAYQGGLGAGGVAPGTGIVQPVDVLVVQASANAMMAFVAALVTTVWLRARSKKWTQSVSS